MNARSAFDAMLAKYAAVTSYQDQGVVLTKWPDETEPNEIVFATFFRRPDRFRFEWTRHHSYPPLRHLKNHHVIWVDGAHAFSYNDHDAQVEPQASLAIAVAGATGISEGSALTVSNLLMPLIDAVSISDLQELDLREHSFEETRCYCIRGRDSFPWRPARGLHRHRRLLAAEHLCQPRKRYCLAGDSARASRQSPEYIGRSRTLFRLLSSSPIWRALRHSLE